MRVVGAVGPPAAVAIVWFLILASQVERTWETLLRGYSRGDDGYNTANQVSDEGRPERARN